MVSPTFVQVSGNYVTDRDCGRMRGVDLLRIMLVDDSPAFLDALGNLLATEPRWEVVARCRSGGEAVESVRPSRPNLAVVDLMMPGLNGIEVTRLLRAHQPDIRVVVVSLHDCVEFRASALDAGAEAFINKSDLPDLLPPLLAKIA